MRFERDLAEKALVEVWASLIDLSDVVAVRALARLALASPRLAQIEWVWTARPLYGPDVSDEDLNFVQEPFRGGVGGALEAPGEPEGRLRGSPAGCARSAPSPGRGHSRARLASDAHQCRLDVGNTFRGSSKRVDEA